jgi:molecular chaperone GrpE
MANTGENKFEAGAFSAHKVDQLKKILKGEERPSVPQTREGKGSVTVMDAGDVGDKAGQDVLREIDTIKEKLDQAEEELASLKEKLEAAEKGKHEVHLRSLAELENSRRRLEREKEEAIRYGSESLLKEILNTVDNLERIIAHLAPGETSQGVRDGMELVQKELLATLQRFGVTLVEAEGLTFDPNAHEAIAERAVAGVASHQVALVHQKGYRYHGRLLRPARVIITS